MSYKTFTLAAIFAASQAIKIESTQKYLEDDFKTPEGPVTAEQVIDIIDLDNDGLLNKEEAWNAFVFFDQPQDADQAAEEFSALWEYLDVNQDDQVDADELAFGLGIAKSDDGLITIPTPEELLALFDLDGNTESLNHEEAANAYFAFYPNATIEEFDEVFHFLDFNSDGAIDAAELYLVMYGGYDIDGDDSQDEVEITPEDVLQQFDWTQNGRLDFNEATQAYFSFFPNGDFNEFINAWYYLDVNADGEIDVEELAAIMSKIANGEPLIPKVDYSWLLDLFDQNQDGALSKAEAAYAYFTEYPWGSGYEFEGLWWFLDQDYSQQIDENELQSLQHWNATSYAQREGRI